MRNLKRALSLTLASVMLLGMMVIGTSAASYPDVTEEHNVEAIEVLQAVGVMSGSDSGNFNPDSNVNRLEMAVVMSNLLSLKVDYFEGQCKFTDVPEWAGKYVAACEANGIVSGIGNNQYGIGNVTATQAALMMLKALGYFQYAQDFQGGWEQETAKLASNLSLFKGLDVANTTPLTRNQVAQLALNTLKADVVVAEKSQSDISVSVGDAVVDITGKTNYVVTASTESYASAIDYVKKADQNTLNGVAGTIIQLGEKLYDGELKLNDNAIDAFGRPARYWEYNGKKMGTYIKKEILQAEFTEKVTGKMLFDTLGSSLVNDISKDTKAGKFNYALNVYVDGVAAVDDNLSRNVEMLGDAHFDIGDIARSNNDKVGQTGKGVLTQVFVDSQYGRENNSAGNGRGVTIAVINTYLAKADKDYDAKKDEVDLKIYKLDMSKQKNDSLSDGKTELVKTKDADEIVKASGADFDIEDVKSGDFFLVNVAEREIQSMVAPEIVSEVTLNSFKKESWVKNDDVTYDYADTAQYDDEVLDIYDNLNMKTVTYNVILDQYGYMIGIELNEEVNQYLFLTGIDIGRSNLTYKNADANVIFLDGTMKTVKVNTQDSRMPQFYNADGTHSKTGSDNENDKLTFAEPSQANTWCTYTVDEDGVYTLKVVGNYSDARNDTPKQRSAKKVAQSAMDMSDLRISTADKAKKELVINSKNRSLEGSKARIPDGKLSTWGDFSYVYGNADSVYINVKMYTINDKGDALRTVVDKVDTVTTGIDNIDITAKELGATPTDAVPGTNPANEVYVLYDKDAYVIGAVILGGEDNGASAKYAYITDGVQQEDDIGGSKWRWTRPAIIDGEEVLLHEVNSELKYINESSMKTGLWYEVRFDKDGNVNGIKANDPDNHSNVIWFSNEDDKFITDVDSVKRALNGIHDGAGEDFQKEYNSLLLFADFTCGSSDHADDNGDHALEMLPADRQGKVATLKYQNQTLYTDRLTIGQDDKGIQIAPNTKIIVCLAKDKGHNNGAFNFISQTFVGDQGMKDALKLLNSDEAAFDGYLSAVITGGTTTSIILDDRAGDKETPDTPVGPDVPTEPGKPAQIDILGDGITLNSNVLNVYGDDSVQLPETGTDRKVMDIKNGVRVSASTAKTYSVTFTGDVSEATVSCTGDVKAELKDGELLITEVKGNGTITITAKEQAPQKSAVVLDSLNGTEIGTVTSDAFGVTTATFTLDVPTWAYVDQSTNSNVSVKYDIYVNGVATLDVSSNLVDGTTAGTNLVFNADKTKCTITGKAISAATAGANVIANNTAKGASVVVVVNEIDWKAAKVEFVDNNSKALTMDSVNTNAFLATGTTAGTLKFKVNTTSNEAATYAVEGAKLVSGASKALTGNAMAHVNDQVNVDDSFVAEGGKVVKVVVTPSAPIAEKYNIAINGSTNNFTATALKSLTGVDVTGFPADSSELDENLSINGNAVVDAGVTATYTVTMGHSDVLVDSVELSYTLDGVAKTATLNGQNNWTLTERIYNVSGDHNLVVTGLKAITVDFLVDAVEALDGGKTLKVTFTKTAKSVRYEDTDNNSKNDLIKVGSTEECARTDAEIQDGVLYVTFADALADGEVVTLDAIVDSDETTHFSKKAEITVAKAANGTYTFTINSNV